MIARCPASVCTAYAFLLAPNQTPTRDTILIKLIVGASQDDTFVVNQVFYRWAGLVQVFCERARHSACGPRTAHACSA